MKRKTEALSDVSDAYKSMIVPPRQAKLRICFCKPFTRSPLVIKLICFGHDIFIAILSAIITHAPGELAFSFLTNLLLFLMATVLLSFSLLLKKESFTTVATKIYALVRIPILLFNYLVVTYFIASIFALTIKVSGGAGSWITVILIIGILTFIELYYLYLSAVLWVASNEMAQISRMKKEEFMNYNEIVSSV